MDKAWSAPVLAAAVLLAACQRSSGDRPPAPAAPATVPTRAAEPPVVTTATLVPGPRPAPSGTGAVPPGNAGTDPTTLRRRASVTTSGGAGVVEVAYRVERRTSDDATAAFVEVVHSTLADPRGWSRAAFRFVARPDVPFLIVLAEGSEVDQLCLPHETYREYSCQRGPVVALNARRWREATPKWTGDLPTYRQMLVNHEVGHLLGQRHPRPQCPRPGLLAPVMAQQSTELDGCLPNPWPLDHEVAVARRHDRPLAPP